MSDDDKEEEQKKTAGKDDKNYVPNPKELDGVPDLSMLVYLEMRHVLHNLHFRFKCMPRKNCYTSVSTILVAINPYERLPVYGQDIIDEFHEASKQGKLPQGRPHPYGVSARSYMRMVQRKCNQSVIVCGESGAGKTETTKLLMRYLAMTAPSASMESSIVEQQIIAASPMLEAYGNAKTVMNNNSSRFGKFTKLLYDVPDKAKEGHILGSYLETYLLEKSRVVFQANNERNYHIFYFLHKGLSPEQLKALHLTSAKDFWYTKQGGSEEVVGVNDKERYDEVVESMKLMRIDSEMMGLWAIAAGILNLGNVEFKKEGDGFASVKTPDLVKKVAELWGITDKALAERLTTSTMMVTGKSITKKMNFDEATTNRDSIAKGFYEQSFLYLCERINAELFQMNEAENEDEEPSIESHLFIGILDVFGFENFYINSLEQFCINFTNEKLQQFFNYHIIRSEQEEYIKESVFWTPLNIPDNTGYIDMVEDPSKGFFVLLDSACKAPQPSIEAWMQEFTKTHGKNPTVLPATQPGSGNARGAPKKSKKKGTAKEKFTGFILKHFADDVTYDSTNFLVKNNEAVHPDTAKMLAKSTNTLIQSVSKIGVSESKKKKQTKLSVTGVFNKGIKMLMKNLKQTEPFFVRCVNPNGIKSATEWQEWVVEGQLRCGGLVEALKVLALGYPTRVPYNTLYEKYHSTVTNPLIRNMGPESFSTALLIAFDVNEDDYELGLTKIFFKPAKAAVLETIMAQAGRPLSQEQNVKITKWVVQKRIKQLVGMSKAFLELRHRVRLKRAAKRWEHVGRVSSMLAFSLNRHLRMAREQILERKRNASALAIQSFFRGSYECARYRKHIVKVKKATKMVWISYRRWNERKLLKTWLEQKVAETRKRKEEERIRMEAARKKELEENARKAEEERLREQARKETETRLEKERQRLQEEERAREELRKQEEKRHQEEEEKKRQELEAEKERARQRIERASVNVSQQKEETERQKAADARLGRENSINMKKKKLQKEERRRKQKREDEFLETNFPELAGKNRNDDDDDDDDEEEDDNEDGDEPKRKKTKKRAAKKGKKVVAKKKKKVKAEEEEDGDESVPGKEDEAKGGDDESEEDPSEDEVEESDASEKDEESVLNVQQQLRTFHKIAAVGQLFSKYTGRRRRKPQDRIVKVLFGERGNPKQISWGSGSRHIDCDDILYIAWGHWTPVFQARKDQLDPKLCFSVVGKTQALDVQAQTKEMAELWVRGLRKLIGQTDEQALKLSKQGLESETVGGGGESQVKKEKDKSNKEQKKHARSLMLLQQDLFVMTTTTVFRNLEEERIWDIDQSVRDRFNAKLLYEEALKEDIPWRQWNHWVRERVVAYLKQNNRVTVQQQQPTFYGDQFAVPMTYNQPVNQVVYPMQPVTTKPVYQQPLPPQRVSSVSFIQQQQPTVQSTMQPTMQPTTGQTGQQDEACTLM